MKTHLTTVLFFVILTFSADCSDKQDTPEWIKKNWTSVGIHTVSYGVIGLGIGIAGNGGWWDDGITWLGVGISTAGTLGYILPAVPMTQQRKAVLRYSDTDSQKHKIARISRGMEIGAIVSAVSLYPTLFFLPIENKEIALSGLTIVSASLFTTSLFVYTIGTHKMHNEELNTSPAISFSPLVTFDGKVGLQLVGTF